MRDFQAICIVGSKDGVPTEVQHPVEYADRL